LGDGAADEASESTFAEDDYVDPDAREDLLIDEWHVEKIVDIQFDLGAIIWKIKWLGWSKAFNTYGSMHTK
jgi:hypothetical protein